MFHFSCLLGSGCIQLPLAGPIMNIEHVLSFYRLARTRMAKIVIHISVMQWWKLLFEKSMIFFYVPVGSSTSIPLVRLGRSFLLSYWLLTHFSLSNVKLWNIDPFSDWLLTHYTWGIMWTTWHLNTGVSGHVRRHPTRDMQRLDQRD